MPVLSSFFIGEFWELDALCHLCFSSKLHFCVLPFFKDFKHTINARIFALFVFENVEKLAKCKNEMLKKNANEQGGLIDTR